MATKLIKLNKKQICLFTWFLSFTKVFSCPNYCSGRGICNGPDLNCDCYDGYTGPDCSDFTCPTGIAWSDIASEDEIVHLPAECSNRGKCNKNTGDCECDAGFTGAACDKFSCPQGCSGRGKCISMKEYALSRDPGEVNGDITDYSSNWDADKVYGCKCDKGFGGPDCSLRNCPLGDDPLTSTANSGNNENEVQVFKCGASQGSFTLTFNGATTSPISVSTSVDSFREIFTALPTINKVTIEFSEVAGPVCSDIVNQVVSIEFLDLYGNVNKIQSNSVFVSVCGGDASLYDICGGTTIEFAYNGDSILSDTGGLVYSREGSKESEFCSNRGLCNRVTGLCECFDNFGASDGQGAIGGRPDCGFATTSITDCPISSGLACSGNGICSDSPTYTCSCSDGWTGGDCSQRTCPSSRSWFDLPQSANSAHLFAECSDAGTCNRANGECTCLEEYEGEACQLLKCPKDSQGKTCSDHGTCLTLAVLATYSKTNRELTPKTYGSDPNDANTWDADSIQGCLCDEGFEGYDCSYQVCPLGTNPNDLDEKNEIQLLSCAVSDINTIIELNIMEHTLAIPASATTQDVITLFQAESVTVSVSYGDGSSICFLSGGTTNIVSIEFLSDYGDLPALSITTQAGLTTNVATNGASLDSFTSQKGTKVGVSCSDRGTCQTSTGTCTCFTGYASSDGQGNVGTRGDCGYRLPY